MKNLVQWYQQTTTWKMEVGDYKAGNRAKRQINAQKGHLLVDTTK